jgi:hypothetical protein
LVKIRKNKMGYLHISNLYRDQTILLFKESYALEKIHGTSAHIGWTDQLVLFSGGEKHENFVSFFNKENLSTALQAIGQKIIIYGEAYGGKQQGQSYRYGKVLKFVAFDVKIAEHWLTVPKAQEIVLSLGLEFVHYNRISTDLACIDAERDAPSQQAIRNGIIDPQPREGVVLRPLVECTLNDGSRIICKHKRDEERETKTPRKVDDVSKLAVLENATEVANEWVTPVRLDHVLDKLGPDIGIEKTREVIAAMVEDVLREGAQEIVDSKEVRSAIGRQAAMMFKGRLKNSLK